MDRNNLSKFFRFGQIMNVKYGEGTTLRSTLGEQSDVLSAPYPFCCPAAASSGEIKNDVNASM